MSVRLRPLPGQDPTPRPGPLRGDGLAATDPAIAGVVARMDTALSRLEQLGDPARHFLTTYRDVTHAVGAAAGSGRVEDPAWLARWDVAFAEPYLEALAARERGDHVAGPWREAFAAPADLHPYLHVLLGMNAHINLDMPLSLLAVLSDADVRDERLMASRHRDHEALDSVIAALVPEQSRRLVRVAGPGAAPGPLDRALMPASRAASRQVLRHGRHAVWRNTGVLLGARREGPGALRAATDRLERLTTDRVADLVGPRHPLLHLARRGFGVRL
ncbi:DUF5995 family protein [Aquipuribacter sp. SD81]|uniref:DUF5995 family protein n=1 Tax=Aquipuribacter sp. SD81 TaxID=3127703 RepID=UPI003018BD0C